MVGLMVILMFSKAKENISVKLLLIFTGK